MRSYSTFVLVSLTLLASCSSVTKPTSEEKNLLGNAILDDKVYGDPLPAWTKFQGVRDGRIFLVGYAEQSINKSEHFIKKAAVMDGEVRLIQDAPSDLRVLTQNALTGAGVDSSEFSQVQTKLSEVIGAQSFKTHDEACRKVLRHTESQSIVMRGCWVSVSANLADLQRAYQLTLQRKYGVGTASRFEDLMKKELDAITSTNNRQAASSETKKE